MQFTDARGFTFTFDEKPIRIISLVPSLTELLFDLGLDDEVIGLTKFCIHPAGGKENKTIVGGTKNVNIERVKALKPDLILANLEENTKADVEELDQFTPVFVTDISTINEAISAIKTIGNLVQFSENATKIANKITSEFALLSDQINDKKRNFKALYFIWQNPWMSIGRDTIIHDVIQSAGGKNVLAHKKRYPIVELDAVKSMDPDVIFLSSEPFPFAEKHQAEMQAKFPDIPVVLVDGEMFSWYGSRLRLAPKYLMDLLNRLPI